MSLKPEVITPETVARVSACPDRPLEVSERWRQEIAELHRVVRADGPQKSFLRASAGRSGRESQSLG